MADSSSVIRTFWQKHRDKVTVAGTAVAGAGIGAVAGGKKGALIGAAAGAGRLSTLHLQDSQASSRTLLIFKPCGFHFQLKPWASVPGEESKQEIG